MIPSELQNRERRYNSTWKAYAIIRRMRWITLILGPVAILWDNVIAPFLVERGAPEFVTMEDFFQAIVFRSGLISQETFERYWPHLNNVCTILFIVFLLWSVQKKRAAKAAAREVVELEGRMAIGGFGGVR